MMPRSRGVLGALMLNALLLMPGMAVAMVDTKSASFTEDWTDLELNKEFSITRTYHSRSMTGGIFGFGWCSELEAVLQITSAEELVFKPCGGDREVLLSRIPEPAHGASGRRRFMGSNGMIVEWKPPVYSAEYVQFPSGEGSAEFDEAGRLRSLTTRKVRHGTLRHYELLWEAGRLTRIQTSRNGSFTVSYTDAGMVRAIEGEADSLAPQAGSPPGLSAPESVPDQAKTTHLSVEYDYDEGGNLTAVRNMWNNRYTYRYDARHNLTRIDFPDKTYKEISYNTEKDWVVSYRNRTGCIESYLYELPSRAHHRTWVEKRCGDEVTNQSVYDFTFSEHPPGSNRWISVSTTIWNNETMTRMIYDEAGNVLETVQDNAPLPPHPNPSWKPLFWPPQEGEPSPEISTDGTEPSSVSETGGTRR